MKITEILDIIKARTSCRKYLDKDVSDEQIKICLEAAQHAPSACNKQPWQFIIVKNSGLREKICNTGLLTGVPMPWLKQAPVIVVLCTKRTFVTHKIAPLMSGVKYDLIDIGIAGEHFVLAAEALGLGTCWIGWFKEKRVKHILSIPHNIKVLSLISLGHPAIKSKSPKRNSINDFTTWK